MALIGNFNFLLSGQIASGAGGDVMDLHRALNYGYLEYVSYSPSAVLGFDFSKDGTAWNRHLTLTASPTTATAQVSAYAPYARAVYVTGWSTSASANMHYAAGTQSPFG